MLIHETVTIFESSAKELRLIYSRFMNGQMDVQDFEDMYGSILGQLKELIKDELKEPNFNQPYTLNDGTIIKNRDDRRKDRLNELQGKVYFDVDPDFA